MKPERIKRIRAALRLTQEAFAARLGVNRVTVVRWESGQVQPHPVYVRLLRELRA